jgi:cytochrome c oxidase subunit 4
MSSAADHPSSAHPPHGSGPNLIYHPVGYAKIFYILVALTAVTVAASFWRAPNELFNVGIALAIATAKAFFVIRFFMHLKFEGKLIYTIFFAPLMLAIILAIALIPDIGMGRHTAFNDMHGFFEALDGKNGQ